MGGPVIQHAKVYAVFWGDQVAAETKAKIGSFFAYHEGFKAGASSIFYGVMPVCGFGCGSGYDALTAVSSHEAIEAITDPFPTPGSHPAYPQAWNDANGEEITDLCPGSSWLTGHGVTNKVSAQWKNSIGGCYNGPWKSTEDSSDLLARLSTRRAPASLPGLRGAEAVCWDGR